MKEYINVLTAFKFAAYIIFIWIHSPYNDSYNLGNNIENFNNIEITSDIKFQRSLAKHIPKKELDHTKVRDRISGNNSYNNVKPTSDDLSKYSQLKKKGLNDLNLYKKNYKHRYTKKNILGKIDCYCEQKIFDKFDYMLNLSEKINMDKKRLKSFFFKKYGSVFIIISLLFLLGIIFPALVYGGEDAILKICASGCTKSHEAGAEHSGYHKSSLEKVTLDMIYISYAVLFTVLPFIYLIFIIYILIKHIKYEKLKAGRDKISLKEYFHFTKSLL